jgi:hypothetical protein
MEVHVCVVGDRVAREHVEQRSERIGHASLLVVDEELPAETATPVSAAGARRRRHAGGPPWTRELRDWRKPARAGSVTDAVTKD